MEDDKMFEKINEKYEQICNIIVSASEKIEWEKIVVRIKKDDNNDSYGFYYMINGKYYIAGELVQENVISDINVDTMLFDVADVTDDIQDIFREYNQEVWTEMVIVITEDMKFQVQLGYDELPEEIIKDEIIWDYRNLGRKPDEKHMDYIKGITVEMI